MSTTTTRPAPAGSAPAPKGTSPARSINLNSILVEVWALIALILIIAIFAILSDNYLSTGNLTTITKQVAFNAIVALGMLLVILNGGIDLSVGSTVGLTGAVAGNLFRGVHVPFTDSTMFPSVWVIVVISIGIGMLVGLANGLLIAKLNLAPFIVTLGMLYVARGLTEVLLNGQNITNELSGQEGLGNTGFFDVFASRPLGLPISAWVMILFAIAISILLTRTPFGRWLYATGSNERAAQLSPKLPFAHYILGMLRLETGNPAGAIPELEIAQKAFPAEAGVYFSLGKAYARVGRKADAASARAEFARLNALAAKEKQGPTIYGEEKRSLDKEKPIS